MNGSKPCSLWVVGLEITLSASMMHFCNLASWLFVCQLLVAYLEESRSPGLECQSLNYLSILYLHGVLLHISTIWNKSSNLPVPSCRHPLPWRTTGFTASLNVLLSLAHSTAALSVSVNSGPIFSVRHFLNTSFHTDLPFSWTL